MKPASLIGTLIPRPALAGLLFALGFGQFYYIYLILKLLRVLTSSALR